MVELDDKCEECGHSERAHKEVQPYSETPLGDPIPGITVNFDRMCEDCRRDGGPCYPAT